MLDPFTHARLWVGYLTKRQWRKVFLYPFVVLCFGILGYSGSHYAPYLLNISHRYVIAPLTGECRTTERDSRALLSITLSQLSNDDSDQTKQLKQWFEDNFWNAITQSIIQLRYDCRSLPTLTSPNELYLKTATDALAKTRLELNTDILISGAVIRKDALFDLSIFTSTEWHSDEYHLDDKLRPEPKFANDLSALIGRVLLEQLVEHPLIDEFTLFKLSLNRSTFNRPPEVATGLLQWCTVVVQDCSLGLTESETTYRNLLARHDDIQNISKLSVMGSGLGECRTKFVLAVNALFLFAFDQSHLDEVISLLDSLIKQQDCAADSLNGVSLHTQVLALYGDALMQLTIQKHDIQAAKRAAEFYRLALDDPSVRNLPDMWLIETTNLAQLLAVIGVAKHDGDRLKEAASDVQSAREFIDRPGGTDQQVPTKLAENARAVLSLEEDLFLWLSKCVDRASAPTPNCRFQDDPVARIQNNPLGPFILNEFKQMSPH